ncbi:MAG: UDP-N-acetylmuramoyl-tripeptide--D-alanyl-D-alanine ligase [Myxococcales bacterium]|nr:UDP-N-acetylmuramoyl-tripeptide--D-alanyl-D-alanine ligase [Myxococcales bacterium]
MAQVAIPLVRVLDATGGTALRGQSGEEYSSVTIDSRAVAPGALFFAVKGDRFDGHDFAISAIAAGAHGIVVARGRGAAFDHDCTVIEVDDPVRALGALAAAHRQAMAQLEVVAITGSNGKTTTKEMVASILSAAAGGDAVLKTEGNLNNHLGVPLTLLRLHEGHRYAVVEMGMSNLGEIAYLTGLARPDVAVVVSVAGVHVETLGSIENVARAKAEIFAGLDEDGIAIYPATESLLLPYLGALAHKMTFGPKAVSPTVAYDEVKPGPTGLDLRLHLAGVTSSAGIDAHLPLIGGHNASNAAAAACVALALDVGEGSILDGLATVKPAKHRAQLMQVGSYTVLDDCYNAAPNSMRAALDSLAEITPPGAQKIAVLGDMLELGPQSAQLHADIGEYAAERVDYLITLGPQSVAMNEAARPRLGDRMLHTEDPKDAADKICEVGRAGDVVLVKASRGLRLERVIDALTAVCQRPRGGDHEAPGPGPGREEES